MRSVARDSHVSLNTVQYWVRRAGTKRLDRVDFSDHRPGPRMGANRTSQQTEDLVLEIRRELKENSPLGEFGATAIHRELVASQQNPVPSVRTIGRILERRGALDGKYRIRRPAPPLGWYLPDVADGQAELDSFDFIEDLLLEGGPLCDILTAISLHGALASAWPFPGTPRASWTLERILQRWTQIGLPTYAQFDNHTRFQGPHQYPDAIGRIIRACLQLGVIPVFVPPGETGFQASIESFNGRWQQSVWKRFHFESFESLVCQSRQFITAHRKKNSRRISQAPDRHPFPETWQFRLRAPVSGRIVYLRRTNEHGYVKVLGHTFLADTTWPHRLVRCEVLLDRDCIQFFALRRRQPSFQPLLNHVAYHFPNKPPSR